MNWELLCKPKREGGLGFRDPKAFNLAPLAKQARRVLTEPNSLLSQVLFGKYCRNNTFLQSKPRSKCSWGWRSLMAGKEVLLKSLFMQVGNGEDINFWDDPWLPNSHNHKVPCDKPLYCPFSRIWEVIDPTSKTWNVRLLDEWLPNNMVNDVKEIYIPQGDVKDEYIWNWERNGFLLTILQNHWLITRGM
uniref:Uncharacterized protein n=1 Tax=Nelumbo nucifera TaxID=4432 RepID=A0A822ZHF5_NELNU|nr:TPA_asm: hypothetical protein HUJ06_002802 [Nelumbo nucifera]